MKTPAKQTSKVNVGVTCDKGDALSIRFTARQRAPYNGDPRASCNICQQEILCVRGYYCCDLKDVDCDYDVCQACYRGPKPHVKGVTCPNGEYLTLRNWDLDAMCSASCDKCSGDLHNGDFFYQCSTNCEYALCSTCYKGEKNVVEGKTCSKGDNLKLRTNARQRAPYDGQPSVACNLCSEIVQCADGYYACS